MIFIIYTSRHIIILKSFIFQIQLVSLPFPQTPTHLHIHTHWTTTECRIFVLYILTFHLPCYTTQLLLPKQHKPESYTWLRHSSFTGSKSVTFTVIPNISQAADTLGNSWFTRASVSAGVNLTVPRFVFFGFLCVSKKKSK